VKGCYAIAWLDQRDALPAADAAEFEAEYSELLREAYPATSHGTVFPFRRIFAVARKRG